MEDQGQEIHPDKIEKKLYMKLTKDFMKVILQKKLQGLLKSKEDLLL